MQFFLLPSLWTQVLASKQGVETKQKRVVVEKTSWWEDGVCRKMSKEGIQNLIKKYSQSKKFYSDEEFLTTCQRHATRATKIGTLNYINLWQ